MIGNAVACIKGILLHKADHCDIFTVVGCCIIMRICAFKSCHNGEYQLYKFREENPDQPDPYILYHFPFHDPQQLHRWCVQINRKNKAGKLWTARKHSRVCSIHFENGKPSDNYPYPTLHLGYESMCSTGPRQTRNSGFVLSSDTVERVIQEEHLAINDLETGQSSTSSTSVPENCSSPQHQPRTQPLKLHLLAKASQAKRRKLIKKVKVYKTFTTNDEKTKFYTGIATSSLYFSLAR